MTHLAPNTFSMPRALAFKTKFLENVDQAHSLHDNTRFDDDKGKGIDISDGPDQVLMTFDNAGHISSGNFEQGGMFHEVYSKNGNRVLSMSNRRVQEIACCCSRSLTADCPRLIAA